ncbi:MULTISPECIES: 2-dehydropantoate 2-reductase [unclassified Oceanobacter]|uniref:2-dehydropantoate 2-reductase n=1 Tax=unclassified Oceanobacter TaxID=2620260 RepID=UPI002733B21C|nr:MULTISPECIES: 2-dehydropantoate 2-reductase [unclassified Oceanobacter]MDP2608588.1 2-dehydropantoate 2-reductase [Oceanobacter sp. 1_MG-2023]MDP2611650.1 2-dehydropantoate 2-reductase [Oceanobacter sp. 2_MG-2023]
MKILVVGAGAVGGLFGGLLQRQGVDVTYLVRQQRQLELASGLTVRLPDQTFDFQPRGCTAAQLATSAATFDLIVLTNKAYSLAEVIKDIRPLVSAQTMILPLLNGLRQLDDLDASFGAGQVLGGIAKTVATLADTHTVVVRSPGSQVTVGARTAAQDKAVAEIRALFADAGITLGDGHHILQSMWDKFCLMAPLGALNCLLQGSVGDYMQSEAGGAIALATIRECTDTAAASGYPLAAEGITAIERMLTNPKSSFTASMYRDMQQGLPIEGEHVVGDMLHRAEAMGVAAPNLTLAHAVLQTYSYKIAARQAG